MHNMVKYYRLDSGDEKMQLSKRLQTVVSMVTPGNRVADIGCDHAYTAIYLVKNNISPYVIAMDVNKGPLDKARDNIKRYGVAEKIIARQSDGMEKLQPGEADTILIAGMGGRLMIRILTGNMGVLYAARELVLQPQSEIHLVRKALKDMGFLIIKESMVKEDGKYYVILKAKAASSDINDRKCQLIEPEHFYFGRLLLEEKNPILLEHLQSEKQVYENIYSELVTRQTKQSNERHAEIAGLLALINRAMDYYKEVL